MEKDQGVKKEENKGRDSKQGIRAGSISSISAYQT